MEQRRKLTSYSNYLLTLVQTKGINLKREYDTANSTQIVPSDVLSPYDPGDQGEWHGYRALLRRRRQETCEGAAVASRPGRLARQTEKREARIEPKL